MNADAAVLPVRERLAALPGEALARLALKLDAVITGANGLAYLVLGGVLDSPLGISASVLRPVGAFLVAFAIAVWAIGARTALSPPAVRAVVGANAIWAADSLIVLIAGWASPTPAGGVWIALQAAVVAGFAALQYAALRRLG